MSIRGVLSKDEEQRIESAIISAENLTSGEIRIHIEKSCKEDSLLRAIHVFNKLKMYETKKRNAVLIYIAYKSKKLSIIGDSGINSIVPENYWQSVIDTLLSFIREERLADGLLEAVAMVGKNLSSHFPYEEGDINEQSNTISYDDKL